MFDALYIGATGMRGQQMQIDAVAHNVANLNTVGFRRSSVSFAEIAAALINSNQNQVDGTSTTSDSTATRMVGAGAMPTMLMSTQPGELKRTGDAMNVAIDGPGFLEVIRPDGSSAYTRAGQLKIDANGDLATVDGMRLAAGVHVPTDVYDLRIDANGKVSGFLPNRGDAVDLGQIDIVGFANAAGLTTLGDNLYAATAQSGDPQLATPGSSGFGSLRQGFLEGSNVQMTDELVTLMLAQRGFELNSKIVQAADQMLAITNGLYR
jgi:flagellar basal-body rod protein FlgG